MVSLKKNKGLKLWNKAKKIIPGGNSLLSKRPDRFAPDIWPTYYQKAKGCKITDLEGNVYIDMSTMGVGANILGYSYKEVDDAVKAAINKGISSTLNSYEEVKLAQKLLNLNPFAGGVKYARSGGEAMSIAVRIARTYTKKDKVAFSGYHGWCDWYIASNLSNKQNLNEHLLPGLSPKGIPKSLKNTSIPFRYNDVQDFEKVMKLHKNVGVIVIEGARYELPSKKFLKKIEIEAKKRNIVIIVDEITSGWRMGKSGVYKILKFNPDIVVYGKGMGNGYAISAVVGKKKIMNSSQDTFISSTSWTERIGFVAALKTIEILNREKVPNHLIKIGNTIGNGWLDLAKKYDLNIKINEFKPLITMKFCYGSLNEYINTLFIQEMLKRGYISSTSVYVSYSHTEKIVIEYLKQVDNVFKIISETIKKKSFRKILETIIRTDSFKRLT